MNIEISTEHLSNDISTMQSRVEELENAKTQVFGCLDNLNGMWLGSAHDAFVAQTGVDSEELNGLIKNLNNLIECMQFAKTEYEKCQDDVSSKIAAILISGDS